MTDPLGYGSAQEKLAAVSNVSVPYPAAAVKHADTMNRPEEIAAYGGVVRRKMLEKHVPVK